MRVHHRPFQFASDLLVMVCALWVAYLLRFEFQIPDEHLVALKSQLPLVVLIQLVALLVFGVYDFIWRYIGIGEIKFFIYAGLVSALPLLGMRLFLPIELQDWRIPVSIIVMDTLTAFGGVLGIRILKTRSSRMERATESSGSDMAGRCRCQRRARCAQEGCSHWRGQSGGHCGERNLFQAGYAAGSGGLPRRRFAQARRAEYRGIESWEAQSFSRSWCLRRASITSSSPSRTPRARTLGTS